jgi:hypothetical protein
MFSICLEFRTVGKVQSPSDSESYDTTSLGTYRFVGGARNHSPQFVTFAGYCCQAGAAAEGYYVIANRSPSCEAGTAVVVTSSNTTTFAVGADGSVKVLRFVLEHPCSMVHRTINAL